MEPAATATTGKAARALVKCRMAMLIVQPAFLRIAQNLVSLAEFLELFLGCFIARIFVRMKFHGEFAVRLLDFLGRRHSFNA